MSASAVVGALFDGLDLRKISQNSRPISPVKELLSISKHAPTMYVEIEVHAPSAHVYKIGLKGLFLASYFDDRGNLSRFFKLERDFAAREIAPVRVSLEGAHGSEDVTLRLEELGWAVSPVSTLSLDRDVLVARILFEEYVKRNYS